MITKIVFVSASIVQSCNGMQPPINVIKIENPSYYCNSYTPPAPDHTSMLSSAQYSKCSKYIYFVTNNYFQVPKI